MIVLGHFFGIDGSFGGCEYEKEIQERETPDVKQDGLFAEVQGNTVRTYKVENGRFCGYSEPKVFSSQEEAVEWVVKETNAKLVIAG